MTLGMRYAYQTLKIAIIHTIRNFRLVKCSETTAEDGLNFSIQKNGFGGIKFKVELLDKNEEWKLMELSNSGKDI